MYGVHISFDNKREPIVRFQMNRREYSDEMLKLQLDYDLEIEQVEEFSTGDSMIFYKAYDRNTQRLLKNIERTNGYAWNYSRENDRAGKGCGTRSCVEG